MAEKLSWTELRRAVAARAGVSEKTAGTFLNALAAQLLEGLRTDKAVKINGLGTFKLQAVAPRKSVNVTTGEEIVIPGYNKIAFAPEAGVKELVESHQDSGFRIQNSEIDPIKKLGEQANEIVDLLADLGQSPKETASLKEERPHRKEKEERPLRSKKKEKSEPEPVVEQEQENSEVSIQETEVRSQDAEVSSQEAEVRSQDAEVSSQNPEEQEKPKKKYHFVRDLLICVVVLLLLLFGGYFFLRNELSSWIESLENSEVRSQKSEEPVLVVEPDTIKQVEEPENSEVRIQDSENMYPELITIEEMHEASRLTWMSKRYYGDKKYWPYLYDANKDRISNPSLIKTGTPIRVPKLTAEQLDTTSVQFQKLREEAYSAVRSLKIED